jgi:hypothetical protein
MRFETVLMARKVMLSCLDTLTTEGAWLERMGSHDDGVHYLT